MSQTKTSQTKAYDELLEKEYQGVIHEIVAVAVKTYMEDFRNTVVKEISEGRESLSSASNKLEVQHRQLQPQVERLPGYLDNLQNIEREIEKVLKEKVVDIIKSKVDEEVKNLRHWIWAVGGIVTVLLILQLVIIFR